MNGKEAYKLWCAAAGNWADWVRPVPFVCRNTGTDYDSDLLDSPSKKRAAFDSEFILNNIAAELDSGSAADRIDYLTSPASDLAIILDLPGRTGIIQGIRMARRGFCPVPIYNGCCPTKGTMSLVDCSEISDNLIECASLLNSVTITTGASPVFLTDANRTCRYKMNVSVFDNSWDIFPQDLPSPTQFLKRGIKKILVYGIKFNKDLKTVLFPHQKAELKIYFTNGYEQPKLTTLKKTKEK